MQDKQFSKVRKAIAAAAATAGIVVLAACTSGTPSAPVTYASSLAQARGTVAGIMPEMPGFITGTGVTADAVPVAPSGNDSTLLATVLPHDWFGQKVLLGQPGGETVTGSVLGCDDEGVAFVSVPERLTLVRFGQPSLQPADVEVAAIASRTMHLALTLAPVRYVANKSVGAVWGLDLTHVATPAAGWRGAGVFGPDGRFEGLVLGMVGDYGQTLPSDANDALLEAVEAVNGSTIRTQFTDAATFGVVVLPSDIKTAAGLAQSGQLASCSN